MTDISRRQFVRRAGLAAAAAGIPAGYVLSQSSPAMAATETISGDVPAVSSKTVAAGNVLEFDPNQSTTLTITGNTENTLLIEGTLRMKPANADVVHKIRFTGGGEIMVMGSGKLDLQGTKKVAWNRTGDDATWRSGDQLIVAPIERGDYSFRSFTKGGSVPSISNRHGTFKAEVMNLSRNVVIEGTEANPMQRIMIMSSTKHTIKYTEVRYAGNPAEVGHYPIHMHLLGEGARGSVIEGTVVHHAYHHAFVVHGTHGVTVKDCIAYDVEADAYWWDLPPESDFTDPVNNTHDIVYDGCIAADVHREDIGFPVTRPNELSAFLMTSGRNNVIRNCVAVGVGGGVRTSGYHWPSKSNAQSIPWVFEDNITHNSREYGIFVWQNTASERHGIDRFVAFNNGLAAVKHGAYNNRGYHYRNCLFFGNGKGMEQNAQTTVPERNLTDERLSFEGTIFDDTPVSLWAFEHNLPPSMFTLYLDCEFAADILIEDNDRRHGWYDFVDCGVTAADFDTSQMHAESIIRVQNGNDAFRLTTAGQESIPPFYDGWTSNIPNPGEEHPDWKASCGNE